MRIGLLTGEYPPLQGGVGDFTRQLARAMAQAGHDVQVLTTRRSPSGAAATPDDAGVTVRRAVERWGWRSLWAARTWAAEHKLDVVNVQYQAAMYSLAAPIHFLPDVVGKPCVATFHDLRIPYLFPKAGGLRHAAVTHLAGRSCAAIATDPADAVELERRGVRSVTQIPIGSNVAAQPPTGYDPVAWRQARGLRADDFVVGYFGFLNHSKGGDTLIDALAALVAAEPRTRLLLIGGQAGSSDATDLVFAERIKAMIEQHHLADRVIRTGYLPEAETSAALLACDVMALPYRDGVSLRRGTLMAALAHGRAIVSTTSDTQPDELRAGEDIVLVAPDAPEQLAQALLELSREPHRRARLGEGARALAARFGWEAIAARTVDVLAACLTRGSIEGRA